MVGKYPVITLCGSTRFKEQFLEKRLTLEGNIVISVGLFGHSGDDEVWTEGTKEMLDDMTYVDCAQWEVDYDIDDILEYKMTDKDRESCEEYKDQLAPPTQRGVNYKLE